MKKLIALLITLSLFLTAVGCGGNQDGSSAGSSLSGSSSSGGSSSADSAQAGADVGVEKEEKDPEYMIDYDSWQMVLVNPWNYLPDDLDIELAEVDMQYRPDPVNSSQLYFDARAIDQLHAMIKAAEADGVDLIVISAYRTNTFQTSNFNNKVNRVMANDPSLTREEAEDIAATAVARPGTSEHQLGLAVDFNSVEDSFRYTEQYAWLVENCTDYGFILRYTAEKQDKTGIIPEPWHYRYVGVENAKLIEASGLCLEEFIEKYDIN